MRGGPRCAPAPLPARAPPPPCPRRSGCSSLRPPGCCASLRGRPPAPLLRPFARPRPGFGVAALRAARFGGRARSAPPPTASPVARAGGRRVPPARAPPSAGSGRSAPPPGGAARLRRAFFCAPAPRRQFLWVCLASLGSPRPAPRGAPTQGRRSRAQSARCIQRKKGDTPRSNVEDKTNRQATNHIIIHTVRKPKLNKTNIFCLILTCLSLTPPRSYLSNRYGSIYYIKSHLSTVG